MTNERLYEVLTGILNSIDDEEYPQIVDTISYNMDDEGNVFADAFEIACELHEADNTKAFPAVVADFLREVYLEEIENHNADAACNLGSLYYTGRIGSRDFNLAVKYYTIAAEGGCRAAQENLGYCYYFICDFRFINPKYRLIYSKYLYLCNPNKCYSFNCIQ